MKSLWRNLTQKRAVDEDLDHEIRSYQALLEDEQAGAGADRNAARRAARLEMGSVDLVKESVRDARAGALMDALATELRQSLRGLRRNLSLTILAILMLALGLGAATTVFSVFYAALVQPLPFRDTAHLVELWETRLSRGISQAGFSEANFWDVRTRNRSLAEVAAYHYDEANLTGSGEPEKVTLIGVSSGFFHTLGLTPVLGRSFDYADDRRRLDDPVAMLGNRFWKNRFLADRQIVGKTLRLNGKDLTVVGVLPPGEPWINDQLYVPFGYRPDADRGSWEYSVIGKLRPVSP